MELSEITRGLRKLRDTTYNTENKEILNEALNVVFSQPEWKHISRYGEEVEREGRTYYLLPAESIVVRGGFFEVKPKGEPYDAILLRELGDIWFIPVEELSFLHRK